ncbi:MAG: TonB-dependent receptor [Alistipes sp.]
MKRILLSIVAVAFALATTAQEKPTSDSLRLHKLQEIEVTATRATPQTPVVYTDISQEAIAKNNYGQDIPFLLMQTPSVIATSETGTVVGATSFRMRGSDATRLNVTANGVPLNNPDSHAMYWYDTPDFISSVGTVQVQRGAGTSTNGTGAFGGSVNMSTASLPLEFEGDASLSYGSYNTNKQAVHIGSGLLGGHWMLDARLTHIGSDGYIDRGATDLKSYMFQGAYYNGNTVVKLLSFGGKAKTYLTYNGVSKADMERYGRRYHNSGQYTTSDGPYILADGTHVNYYDDQTDNYLQINNQLLVSHRFNQKWTMNATAHYTYGYGYYKQYKDDASLMGYGLSDNWEIEKDLIREKIMRNHFGGIIASAGYTADRVSVLFGGSWSLYKCPHWGELDWVQDNPEGFTPGMRWYDNDVEKQDANLFAKVNWTVAKGLNIYADLQYRYVNYTAWGVNDNFDWNKYEMQPIDVNKTYHFFNPKAGINYTLGKHHNFYFSFAIAQKEPTRSDFTDRFTEAHPSSEKMYDYELGYHYDGRIVSAGINLYYMKYKDQLVKTGQVNDASDALNVNVPDSYRRGIELTLSARVTKWFTFSGNATFSQNRIENYVDLLTKSPDYGKNLGAMTISYSPNVIAGTIFDFHVKGFEAILQTQYVGKQYFTNNEVEALSLDRYCVSNLNLAYTLHTKKITSVRFGLTVYNIFNADYSNNGYGYSYMDDGKRYDDAFYFPQAPLNVLANITVKF